MFIIAKFFIDLKRLTASSSGGAKQQTERLLIQRSETQGNICDTESLDNPTFCPHRNSTGVDIEAVKHKGKTMVMDWAS